MKIIVDCIIIIFHAQEALCAALVCWKMGHFFTN